ncbi:MAG: LemA family protein [Candidatus Omnitrophota bacterium]
MKKEQLIVLGVVLLVIVLAVSFFTGTYNRLVAAEENVDSSWSQVENVYQRRTDLVPNLVAIVRAYAKHEKDTLEGVINARAKASQMNINADVVNNPEMLEQFQKAQGALSSALSRLMVVIERYPELKADQNFLTLQAQIEGTENRITVERKRYNDSAKLFNTLRRTFPNIFIAKIMGFAKKSYFTADEGADKAPAVKF